MSEEPVPTTKQELIQMLKDQLEKVQDEISSMQNTLEEEKEKRKQLTLQLQQKQTKIKQLIQNQSKTLGDKVQQGLINTLEAANKMRADAETEVRTLSEDTSIINEKITHRDSKITQDRGNIMLNSKKVGSLEQKKIDCQRKQQNLVDKKEQVRKNLQMMKNEHERIDRQQKQLRMHIENMKKLKLYLNKNLEGNVKNQGNLKASNKPTMHGDNFWTGN